MFVCDEKDFTHYRILLGECMICWNKIPNSGENTWTTPKVRLIS